MEADREGRALHITSQSRDDVRAMIFAYPGTDEILFTSGEPTLSPNLLEYVGWAKTKGFSVIGLISNGRRFAYRGFVDQLVAAGLNHVTVSIHGHCAELHDGLTRAPGSFAQTQAGLVHLTALRKSHALCVQTSTVVTRRNLPHVQDILALLQELRVDSVVFNIMMAKGRGAKHIRTLMPRYDDVIDAFAKLSEGRAEEDLRKLRVVDVPRCIAARLPPGMQGESEEFDQYELIGSTGIDGLAVPSPATSEDRLAREPRTREILQRHLDSVDYDDFGNVQVSRTPWKRLRHQLRSWSEKTLAILRRPSGPAQFSVTIEAFETLHGASGVHTESAVIGELQGAISKPSLAATQRYYATSRSFKDRFLRAKGEPCRTCSQQHRCSGVWEPYVQQFGWSEFRPLSEDDTSSRPQGATSNLRD